MRGDFVTPVVSCPQVPPHRCPARTAEGRCTRDAIVLDGPDAYCSYLREQSIRRIQLRIKEIRELEKKGVKITDFWDDEEERD